MNNNIIKIASSILNGKETALSQMFFTKTEQIGPIFSKEELMTDYGNGQRFVLQHRDKAFYSHEQKNWFLWDGKRWVEDTENKVVQLAHDTAKSIVAEAGRQSKVEDRDQLKKWAATSLDHPRIKKMLETASSYLTRKLDVLDPNKSLLNVNNGTVDLVTGELKHYDRGNLISKLCPVNYMPEAQCPTWIEFLNTTFSENIDLINYLQKVIGYSLTGEISEKCFFIFYGPEGDNGKSVLMNVLMSILGDYAVQTPVDTFLSRKPGTQTNDLVRIRTARLVSAAEASQKYCFDEPMVKRLTGDDPMVVRALYKEYITFYPECKIVLATNQIPRFKGDDVAFSKRIRIIPFMVTIPPEKQDPNLKVKLLGEKEGILNWCVQGSKLWYINRLGTLPVAVEPEVEYTLLGYLISFIESKCITETGASERTSELNEAFTAYILEHNLEIDPLTSSVLGSMLNKLGYISDHKNNGNIKLGIRLNPSLKDIPGKLH